MHHFNVSSTLEWILWFQQYSSKDKWCMTNNFYFLYPNEFELHFNSPILQQMQQMQQV